MKKLFEKARDTPTCRKQAFIIYKLFYVRVCQSRDDLKTKLDSLKQLGEEFTALVNQS